VVYFQVSDSAAGAGGESGGSGERGGGFCCETAREFWLINMASCILCSQLYLKRSICCFSAQTSVEIAMFVDLL